MLYFVVIILLVIVIIWKVRSTGSVPTVAPPITAPITAPPPVVAAPITAPKVPALPPLHADGSIIGNDPKVMYFAYEDGTAPDIKEMKIKSGYATFEPVSFDIIKVFGNGSMARMVDVGRTDTQYAYIEIYTNPTRSTIAKRNIELREVSANNEIIRRFNFVTENVYSWHVDDYYKKQLSFAYPRQ